MPELNWALAEVNAESKESCRYALGDMEDGRRPGQRAARQAGRGS